MQKYPIPAHFLVDFIKLLFAISIFIDFANQKHGDYWFATLIFIDLANVNFAQDSRKTPSFKTKFYDLTILSVQYFSFYGMIPISLKSGLVLIGGLAKTPL